MRPFHIRHALSVLLALLVLTGCHDKDNQPAKPEASSTPESAVQQSVALIKAGDFEGFWKQALPPADYATLRADWGRRAPDEKPVSDEDRANFAANLRKLTEPDAEAKLYAELRPKLVQAQQQYKDQLPVMVGIFQAIATTGIEQSKQLTPAQKQQARDVLAVLAPWAQQAPWFDLDKAKQALATVVDTARKLDLKDADQLRAMDFDTAMKKYATAFDGARKLLAYYGLSVDDTLDSVKATALENGHGSARMKIDYTLLGKPLSTEITLVQQDGHWYDRDLLQNVRDEHQRLLQPAAAGSAAPVPAPAGSVPAPAGSAASRQS